MLSFNTTVKSGNSKKLERYVNKRKKLTEYYMQNCTFGKKAISYDAAIVANPKFENAVVKIHI